MPAGRDAPWSVRARLRLRTLFIRQITRLGRALNDAAARQETIRLYERGLEADDLAEQLYEGLMRCHLALGSVSDGMVVFRRLRQILSVVLGVAPSASSEAIARELVTSRPTQAAAPS